ncbi:MAG: cupin domain-containing protein [Clostridiales bacterium]|nr:cupin domain-containing protein [Clostridiales bacterium]
MIIDFLNMTEDAKPNFKGGEKAYNVKMFNTDGNKIMRGRLVPGASIGFHTHTEDQEVIYILEGEGSLVDAEGNVLDKVLPGQATLCPKGESHSLANRGDSDLLFFAVVTSV